MKQILANLSTRQRVTIALAVILAAAGIYALVQWRREADFQTLYAGLAPEDAAGVVKKLKETGTEYRLADGGAILAPSGKIAETRIVMAEAGLPKSGRAGFELFDKTNLGATEFAEHVTYLRALEGELERSVMSIKEVEQARVHVTLPKESVFTDEQQPAKASVLIGMRPGSRLTPRNVLAINYLVASAVQGLSPDAVSVLDMNGNLLGRPKPPGGLDGPEPSEGALDYRRKLEADLVAKIGATLEPVLGAEKFRAGAAVECDFTGGDQSEEIFDPARSVMASSQRTEDDSGGTSANGVPGTASALPRPTSRPGSGSNRVSRVTENITYQTSRTVRKSHTPAGAVRKMSLSVLVDQAVTWEKDGSGGNRRVLVPPDPEQLKKIHDLVAGVTGLNTDRGDQLIVETLPFQSTLLTEPPQAQAKPAPGPTQPALPFGLNRKTMIMIGAGAAAVLLIIVVLAVVLRRKRPTGEREAVPTTPAALPAAAAGTASAQVAPPGSQLEQQMEAKLAERDALQKKMDAQALSALKLTPTITKTSEVLAKHLREKVKEDASIPAQVLQSWIRDDGS